MTLWATGWGFEATPIAQVRERAGSLALALVAGATSGACVAYTLRADRRWVTVGAVIGMIPGVAVIAGYVTDTY